MGDAPSLVWVRAGAGVGVGVRDRARVRARARVRVRDRARVRVRMSSTAPSPPSGAVPHMKGWGIPPASLLHCDSPSLPLAGCVR